MSYRELYCTKISGFLNSQFNYKDSKFVIFGFPYDSTSTFISGSRFGPDSIRRASINLETFNIRKKKDVKNIKLIDIGDIDIDFSNTEDNIKKVEKVISEIYKDNKVPIILGGEHTVTLGAVKPLKKFVLICFDAHLDLRLEYAGSKISHSTVMRRILEQTDIKKLIFIGTRAISEEEFEYAKNNPKIKMILMDEIDISGPINIAQNISKELEDEDRIYVSVDMDVFDPSVIPSVGNPEPGGLEFNVFKKILFNLNLNFIGLDVVEINPRAIVDTGAIYAAKIIFETLNIIK